MGRCPMWFSVTLKMFGCGDRRQPLMSALPPKADKERTCRDVRFVPKADICSAATDYYSMTSSASCWNWQRTSRPSALAVLRFRNSSTFVACWTGVVLPPPDKRTHAVRQDRRLVEIHLLRQGSHQHRDLSHVLGGHDVIVARLLTVAGLGPPAPRRERRQRG